MEKALGLQLTGTLKSCEACALGKTKMTGASKITVPCSTVKGERLFFDISSPFTAGMVGRKHWLLIMKTLLIMP